MRQEKSVPQTGSFAPAALFGNPERLVHEMTGGVDATRRSLKSSFSDVSGRAPARDEPEPKNLIPDDPSTKGVTWDEYLLRVQSGYYNIGYNTRMAPDKPGPHSIEEKKRKEQESAAFFRQMLDTSSMFSVSNVLQRLQESITLDNSWMNINQNFVEVKPEQMLHVKDGKVIDPSQDPERKYLIRTLEEKRAYEQSIRGCSALFAQEEVTLDNGRMVNVNVFQTIQSLQASIERKNDARLRVERGEIDPQNLDEDLKKEIENRTRADFILTPDTNAQIATVPSPVAEAPAHERKERVFTPAPSSPAPGF